MDLVGCHGADPVLLVGGYYRYRTILLVLDDIPGPPSFWQTSNSDQASDTQNRELSPGCHTRHASLRLHA